MTTEHRTYHPNQHLEAINASLAQHDRSKPHQTWRRVNTELQQIFEIQGFPQRGNIWRRCNLQAEKTRINSAIQAQNKSRIKEEEDLVRSNIETLSKEFNFAMRISEHWMKILLSEEGYQLRYWDPFNSAQREETTTQARQRQDVFQVLDAGIAHATNPQREKVFKDSLVNIIEMSMQDEQGISILVSAPPETTDSEDKEGFGTHTFTYIFFTHKVSDQEVRIQVKQLRSELSREHHIAMLNKLSPGGPALQSTASPDQILAHPIQIKPSETISNLEDFIENTIYTAMQDVDLDKKHPQSAQKEKEYREDVLSSDEIAKAQKRNEKIAQLYVLATLKNAPLEIRILLLTLYEYTDKDFYIKTKANTKNSTTKTAGYYAQKTSSWSKQGTLDCTLEGGEQTSQIKTDENNEEENNKKFELQWITCPDEQGGCGHGFWLLEGMTCCPYVCKVTGESCGWDPCEPKTSGLINKRAKKNTLNHKQETVLEKPLIIEDFTPIITKEITTFREKPVSPIRHSQTRFIFDETTQEAVTFIFGIPVRRYLSSQIAKAA